MADETSDAAEMKPAADVAEAEEEAKEEEEERRELEPEREAEEEEEGAARDGDARARSRERQWRICFGDLQQPGPPRRRTDDDDEDDANECEHEEEEEEEEEAFRLRARGEGDEGEVSRCSRLHGQLRAPRTDGSAVQAGQEPESVTAWSFPLNSFGARATSGVELIRARLVPRREKSLNNRVSSTRIA